MRRDRSDRKSCNHSPFSALKGLPVSGRQEQRRPPPATANPPSPRELPTADDAELFSREMEWLDVRPMAGATPRREGDGAPATPKSEADAREFLAAVAELDQSCPGDMLEPGDQLRARARRMKQLERGELKPAAELDLHGLTRSEAVLRTRAFLAGAARRGWPVVVIVTGKGTHSNAGPVLRQAVTDLLATSYDLVLEWGAAPRRLGGAGALVVFVRSGSREV